MQQKIDLVVWNKENGNFHSATQEASNEKEAVEVLRKVILRI